MKTILIILLLLGACIPMSLVSASGESSTINTFTGGFATVQLDLQGGATNTSATIEVPRNVTFNSVSFDVEVDQTDVSPGQVWVDIDQDGTFEWEDQSTVSALSLRGTSKPVFDKNFLYVGFGNGNLVKIESRSGVIQWEVPVTVSEGVSEIERMIDIDAKPVISSNGLAYAVTYQGDLSAIEIEQGRTIWRSSTSSTNNIIYAKNKTFIVDSEDFIRSYDGVKGNSLWVLEDFKLRQLSSPKRYQDFLIVGDFEGYLHLIDLNNGSIEARFRPTNKAVKEVFIFNDAFFSLDDSGKISALKIK